MRYLLALYLVLFAWTLWAGDETSQPAPAESKSTDPVDWMKAYKDWRQISNYYRSETHWLKDVRVFIDSDEGREIYRHNNQIRMLELEGAEADEIKEAGGFQLYPNGTLIAKENHFVKKGERRLDTVTFMFKRSENDWHYSQVNSKNEVIVDSDKTPELANGLCIACHTPMKERDYLFHSYFVEEPED